MSEIFISEMLMNFVLFVSWFYTFIIVFIVLIAYMQWRVEFKINDYIVIITILSFLFSGVASIILSFN